MLRHTLYAILTSFIVYTGAQKVNQCYICRKGCESENVIGFLRACPPTFPSHLSHVEKICYRRFLKESKVADFLKDPFESEILDEDLQQFKLPRAYRSCGLRDLGGNNTNTRNVYNSAGDIICKDDEREKLQCIVCNDGDGCNGNVQNTTAKNFDSFPILLLVLAEVIALIII